MSDLYYDVVHAVGTAVFWASSKALVLHRDRAKRMRGPYILAANHHSLFDVPLLIRHTPQRLDFLSTVEVFRHPFSRWFYGSMNAFPIDRSRPEGASVRAALYRLRSGRVVAIFPEGAVRPLEKSVTAGGPIRPGASRLAQMAGVPVLPAVILNTAPYVRPAAWLPLKQVRYGLIYGEPIPPPAADDKEAAQAWDEKLKATMVALYSELRKAMGRKGWEVFVEEREGEESDPGKNPDKNAEKEEKQEQDPTPPPACPL